MKFNGEKAAFGRHETFALRYGWITKGVQALMGGEPVFEAEDATVQLGVGKNMVSSIRYWLQAAQIAYKTPSGWELTEVGDRIFGDDGYDPYLEDEATIWLLHWLIASNPEQATAWFWFFNYFHKPEFETAEAVAALLDFSNRKITARCAATTVEKDATLVLRMFARARGNTRTPLEDMLDSPLTQLKLITRASTGRGYVSAPAERGGLPVGIFGYAVAELFNDLGVSELPITDLMYSKSGYPSPGAVFRLTENALVTKLENLVHSVPGLFEVRETAGIHQVYRVEEAAPMHFLAFHYLDQAKEMAA